MDKHKLAYAMGIVDKATYEYEGYLITVLDTRRDQDQYKVTIGIPRPISTCFQTTEEVEAFLCRTIPYTPFERVWTMLEDEDQ